MSNLEKRVSELEEANSELVKRLSGLEKYLGIEWYDVSMRERYVKKENYGRPA